VSWIVTTFAGPGRDSGHCTSGRHDHARRLAEGLVERAELCGHRPFSGRGPDPVSICAGRRRRRAAPATHLGAALRDTCAIRVVRPYITSGQPGRLCHLVLSIAEQTSADLVEQHPCIVASAGCRLAAVRWKAGAVSPSANAMCCPRCRPIRPRRRSPRLWVCPGDGQHHLKKIFAKLGGAQPDGSPRAPAHLTDRNDDGAPSPSPRLRKPDPRGSPCRSSGPGLSITRGATGAWSWRQTMRKLIRLGMGLGAGLFTSAAALAQDPSLEEVVVTAQKRSERLQDVPNPGGRVHARPFRTPASAARRTSWPRFPTWNLRSGRHLPQQLRGRPRLAQVTNADPPIAVIVDGVPQVDQKQFNMQLFDLEQIEVLKGPQGSLYGRDAIGGHGHQHAQSDRQLSGYADVTAGNGRVLNTTAGLSGRSAATRCCSAFLAIICTRVA